MKKIINLIFLCIIMISCMKKIDVSMNMGSVSLNIGGSSTSSSKNVSRAITIDTSKIVISLFKPSSHTTITRVLDYTAGQKYNLTIDNLEAGEWDLHIFTYSDTAQTVLTGMYFDIIKIVEEEDTAISHVFGAPQKVLLYDLSSGYAVWSGLDTEFIGNAGEITDDFNKYIGFQNKGSSYHVTPSTLPEDTLTQVEFIIATDKGFKNIVPSYNSGMTSNSFIITNAIQYDEDTNNPGNNFAYAPIQISSSTYGYGFYLSNNTTYYWKAKLTNSIGTTVTDVFSFKTAMP